MRTRNVVVAAVVVGMLAVFGIGYALAQRPGGGGPGGGGRPDAAQMQQRMMDRMKETLGSSDEEWKVLQPLVEKVMTLSRELTTGGRGVGANRRGGQPDAATEAAAPQSDVAKATQDLRTTLDNKDAAADVIKAKLTALREAREKAKQELTKAQDSLREILTVRQEAVLVMNGTLE